MKANQRRNSTHTGQAMSSYSVPESNSNQKPSKRNTNHIGGIPIEFPYPPYGSQLAYMSRVIATLDRAQRDGHFHALLESPTGTGKSLSLLCSVLAWQKNQRSKPLYGNISHSKPDPEALVDPLGHGGGFVPEMEPSPANLMPTLSETNNVIQKKKRGPIIYYATRTHSQISQVIGEFRKTCYHVPMAVLGSRKRYCTNPNVRGQDNIDEKCKLLLKENKQKKAGCREFVNYTKIRAHPSVRKGGCYEIHDIEDLIKVGETVEGCSYFGAQAMAEVADIVFCPYSYIVNPQIRKAMEISVKGNIIILDEAHNIEDIAREAGSIDVDEGVLFQLQKELENLCQSDPMIYQPLYEMIEGIMSWISLRKNSLGKHSFQHKASCWGAEKALKELQEASISMQCFPSLQDCATKAIKIATDADPEVAHLSGMPCTVLEGLFSSLTYFFSEDGKHICDYQLVLQCHINSDAGNGLAADDWPCTFSLWCLNPALVFKNMADSALSVILTSGTLSPMTSFQSELGVQFGTSLEAPHVINVDSQLWAGVIHSGPDNYPLNASYKTSEAYGFQDALGTSLEEICKVVPGGCLVFFPSYKLMDKLRNRWSQTGQWSRLNAQKPVFVEPRGGQDDFEQVLKDYYRTIRQGNKPVTGRRRGKKWDANCCNATKSKGNSNGAMLLAVCRGKVSEGIDFSDENARAVIIVGIPFPNVFDIQVAEKKKYNDTYKSSKSLLSGNEWYCQQAFRALNQAAGRCIRHRFDYGAIIFLDERFRQEKNLTYVSKWIRKSIRQHDNFDQSIEGLKSFFRDIKVESNRSCTTQPIVVEPIDVGEPRNWFTEMKNNKVTKPNLKGQRSFSDGLAAPEIATKMKESAVMAKGYNCSITSKHSKAQEVRRSDKSDNDTDIVHADLETQDRCLSPEPVTLSPNDFELTVVNETPTNYDNEPFTVKETPIMEPCLSTVEPVSEDEHSTSTIFQRKRPDRQPPHSFSSPCSTSAFVTPNKQHISQNRSPMLDLSVNSLFSKRRKPSVVKMESLVSPDPKTPTEITNFAALSQSCIVSVSSTTFDDTAKKDLKLSCSLCKYPLGLKENDYVIPCSSMSLPKVHLASIWKGELEKPATSVPVMVSDVASVDRRIWERSPEQGIWSKEDGCVFNKVFCTSCTNQESCLGLHVVATDSSNVQFLNKVLFYSDRLDMEYTEVLKNKEASPSSSVTSGGTKSLVEIPFEKYAFVPPQAEAQTNSGGGGGWRTTKSKSKLRLPKRSSTVTQHKH